MRMPIMIALAVMVIGFALAIVRAAISPRPRGRSVSTGDGYMPTFVGANSSDWGSANDISDCSSGDSGGGCDGGGGD